MLKFNENINSFDSWGWALNAARSYEDILEDAYNEKLLIATIGMAQSGKTTALIHLILDEPFYKIDKCVEALRGGEEQGNSATPVPIKYIPKKTNDGFCEINDSEIEALKIKIANLRKKQSIFFKSETKHYETVELPGKWRRKDIVFIDIPGHSSSRIDVEKEIAEIAANRYVKIADIVAYVAPGENVANFKGYKGSFECKMLERIEITPSNCVMIITKATELANDDGSDWESTIKEVTKLKTIPQVLPCSFKKVNIDNENHDRKKSVERIEKWLHSLKASRSKVLQVFSKPIAIKREKLKLQKELDKKKDKKKVIRNLISNCKKNEKDKEKRINKLNRICKKYKEKIFHNIKKYLDMDIEFKNIKKKEIFDKVNTHIHKVINFTNNAQNIETVMNKLLNELIDKYSSSNENIRVSEIIKPGKMKFTSNYNREYETFEELLENQQLKKRILFWGDKDDDILKKIENINKIINAFYPKLEKVLNNHLNQYIIDHKYENQSKNKLAKLENKIQKIDKDIEKTNREIEVVEKHIRRIGNYPKILKYNYIKEWNKYMHRINDYRLSIEKRLRYLTYCNLMTETLREIIEMKTINLVGYYDKK